MKLQKTNAARLLDKAGIEYELIPYEVDENDLAAGHVARQLGEPVERVFKTLVLEGDRSGHFICVQPRSRATRNATLYTSRNFFPLPDISGEAVPQWE